MVVSREYPPIGEYALIGDCRSAALVSRDGSIDWLCFPRYDSPSIFAALLDAEQGGRFRIRPTGEFQVERRYLPDTNILETTFRTTGGGCVLRDLMPVASEEEKRTFLAPEHQVLREIEGVRGEVELDIEYQPRPDYARLRPELTPRGELGLWCEAGTAAFVLGSEVALVVDDGGASARGTARVRTGERLYLSLAYTQEAPAVIPPLGELARATIERSSRWWQDWAKRCTYQGPYREMVLRSALALKLMAHAPSGAVVAAPTTSLPEQVGGPRNWDYRYCWLRDAAFTLRALFALGYDAEASAFLDWMLHATRLTWPKLQVVYDVFGEAHLPERELPHLEGYAASRPVRIGNGAYKQLQLDVYGEIIDAAALFAEVRGRFSRDTERMLTGLGKTVCRRWREPDEGIWEVRSKRAHYTHSKVLCWIGLDRLIKMHEAKQIALPADDLDLFRSNKEALRAEIEARGYNRRLQSYTRTFDGEEMDASLLVLPLHGYSAATDARIRSTCARILEKLGQGSLVYRYEADTVDGLPPGEGAFGVCSFWAVECLAKGGDMEAATRAFEELLGYANDVGLLAEEIDPRSGAALGNFPQAFTHVGLINAAITLAECREQMRAVPREARLEETERGERL